MFLGLARAVAGAMGLKDLPLVVFPHPLGGLEEDKVREKAELAIDSLIQALTAQG